MKKLNPSAEWIRNKSIETWNRIEFSRQTTNVRTGETTITENLIFDFWMAAKSNPFFFQLYEATNERVNGNDLELILKTVYGDIKFAVQAKIIKEDDRYHTLPHKAKSATLTQAEMLINYAQSKKAIPIYLFYNYTDDKRAASAVKTYFNEAQPQHLGMSVVPAKYIKTQYLDNRIIPDFLNLHLNPLLATIPFYSLFYNNMQGLKYWGALRYVQPENDHNDWYMLAGPRGIGGIGELLERPVADPQQQESQETFSPKFRLVVTLPERRRGGIYDYS